MYILLPKFILKNTNYSIHRLINDKILDFNLNSNEEWSAIFRLKFSSVIRRKNFRMEKL